MAENEFAESTLTEVEAVVQEVLAFRATKDRLAEERSLVTLTYAQALDGSIAAGKGGAPLLLSNRATMFMTHRLRAVHDGILIGINTVISDNPSLNTRLCKGPSPRPIVLDSDLRCPPNAKLLQLRKAAGEAGPIIVYQDKRMRCEDSAQAEERNQRKAKLEAEGVTTIAANGNDWTALLTTLRCKYNIRHVMVEGGARVIRSMLTEGKDVLDAVVVTIAPVYVGGLVPSQPWDATSSHTRLKVTKSVLVDGDIVVCGQVSS